MRISRLMGLTAAVMLSCGGVLGGSVLSANAAPNAVEAHSVVLAPRAAVTAAAANGDTIPVKGSNPTAVAFSPDGSYAYVTSAASTTVTKINTADASTSAITVGTTPRGVAFSPDGTFAYVANFGSNTVTKINTADNTTSSIAVGTQPVGVAFSPDGSFAYVTNYGSNNVTKIIVATGAKSTISVGTQPWGVAMSPDGSFAYVANYGSKNVTKINTANNTTSTIGVGTNPWGVAISPDGSFAYVSNSGSNNVTKIVTAGGTSTISTPFPMGVAISPDGSYAYVVNNTDSGTVTRIETADGTQTTIPVGRAPMGVGFSPDGSLAYVTNQGGGTVSVIAAGTPEVTDVQVDHTTTPQTLSGHGVPGATVSFVNTAGDSLGSTTVQGDGSWSAQLSAAPGPDNIVNVVQTVGVTASAPLSVDVGITVSPLTAPNVDTTTAPPTLTGTAMPGATVAIKDSTGNIIGETTADGSGAYSVELSSFPQSDKEITLTQTVEGVTSAPFTTPIEVVVPAPGNPTVDATTTPSTLSGTGGIPGATIHLSGSDGTSLGQATVGPDGNWSTQLTSAPTDGIVQLVQSVNGIDSLPNQFNLADAPVINPGIAFATAITGIGAAGLLIYRRRRGTPSASTTAPAAH